MDVILDQSVAMAVVLNSSSGDSRVISVWRGSRYIYIFSVLSLLLRQIVCGYLFDKTVVLEQ